LEQIEMLEKGWSLASQLLSCEKPKRYNRDDLKNVFSDLSDLSDSSENSGPGNSKTEVRIKSRKVRVQSRKPDKKGEEAGHGKTVLEATLELLKEHPDLRKLIVDASRRLCPIAERSMEIVARLANGGKILHSPANVNVLTVEDMLSFLLGQSITTTAMYRMIELSILKYSNYDIIPPATVDLYLKTPDQAHMMDLASFFRPIEGAPATKPNQVYVLNLVRKCGLVGL
jgi:hypothetical protein